MNSTRQRYGLWLLGVLTCLTLALFVGILSSPQTGKARPLVPNADEVEPNDTFATANNIGVAEIVFGAITATNDLDYFVISTVVDTEYQVVLSPLQGRRRAIEVYDANQTRIANGETGTSSSATLSFIAQTTTYYIRISVLDPHTTSGQFDYRLQVDYTATPTPTDTATPTNTATPTQTPLPPPGNIPIETEPNDEIRDSDYFTIPGRIAGAITSIYDIDCFAVDTVIGLKYRIILQDYEFNRWLKVYDANEHYVMGNTTATNHEVELTLEATFNRYYLCVSSVTTPSPSNTIVDYILEMIILQPTPTPTNTFTPTPTGTTTPSPETPVPKPTWPSGFDEYEPNFNFETATTLAPGLTYDLNFMPWGGASVDNDFFRIRVKPGLQLTCETSDLDPGVDPNMVFYSGPGEQYFLTSNDDIELGNFNSRISYYSTYEGYVYILVGQGQRMDARDARNSAYTLTCDLTVPGEQATPAPGNGGKDPATATPRATSTPRPTNTPETPSSPVATPTPPPEDVDKDLDVRLVTTPQPVTPTPKPGGFRTFRVLVYYDDNDDGQFGAGEGVPGFFVRVLMPESREELARGYTDDQGQLSFTVPTVNTVRVLVPLLGFDKLIEPSKPEVSVRIAPPPLPSSIP
jgi:hypothetical protein